MLGRIADKNRRAETCLIRVVDTLCREGLGLQDGLVFLPHIIRDHPVVGRVQEQNWLLDGFHIALIEQRAMGNHASVNVSRACAKRLYPFRMVFLTAVHRTRTGFLMASPSHFIQQRATHHHASIIVSGSCASS
jgi:hypothetical protein